jgi:hypothetical protein
MDERLLFSVGCGCEWLSLVPMVACKIRGQGQSLCLGNWCKACQRAGCVEQQAAAALGQNHSPAQGRGKAAGPHTVGRGTTRPAAAGQASSCSLAGRTVCANASRVLFVMGNSVLEQARAAISGRPAAGGWGRGLSSPSQAAVAPWASGDGGSERLQNFKVNGSSTVQQQLRSLLEQRLRSSMEWLLQVGKSIVQRLS